MRIFLIYSSVCVFWFAAIKASAQLTIIDSLEHQQSISHGNKKIDVLLELADLQLSGNLDRSFQCSREAVEIASSINDKNRLGKSYEMLGVCYSNARDHDSSFFYLNMALAYIPTDAMTYYFLGENEWFNGDYLNCTTYYKTGEKYAIENLDMRSLGIIYYSYSDYYRYLQEIDSAQYYISLSLKILERSTLYKDLAMAYNIQAEIYRNKGEYKKALDTYITTAQIAYQIVDSNRIGYCFSRMGYIYYMQELYGVAEKYLLKSLEISRNVSNQSLELFNLKALTDMYSAKANVSKCKYYADLCIRVANQANDPTGLALAYSSLSNLYYRVHNTDSATIYADRSYRVAKLNQDDLNMLNAILNKVQIEFEEGNYIEVVRLTTEGIQLAEITQAMEQLKDVYKYRYYAYEKMNEHSAALDAFAMFKMYEDSLQTNAVRLGVHKSQLEMNYQDKRLKDTLTYITNVQKSEAEVMLHKQRTEFSIAIGVLTISLLSVIMFTIWTTSQKRKKLNRSLAESNSDKELLLKEIHHRVKNSLQNVSSLLNLQRSQSGIKTMDQLIDESQVRINNIAIVHELLYQSGSFKQINLKEYIHKLSDYILQTLGDPDKLIQVKENIEDINIKLEKSVPLALVINEILTNSVKYAFKNRKEGIISITCSKKNGRIELDIRDNGEGMAETGPENAKGIGITLIKGFVKQLKGEVEYGNNNGCFFVISFPDNE